MVESKNVLGKIRLTENFRKMNITKYILGFVVLGASFASCDKNDTVLELGGAKGIVAEVYMENLDPSFSAGADVQVPISYWMEGKQFKELAMYHSYDSVATVVIKSVANNGYAYENEFSDEIMEQELYSSQDHDPAFWTPTEYAYFFETTYTIDPSLAKVKYTNAKTAANDFASLLSAEFYTEFYNDLAYGMTKDQLNQLLVVDYSIISSEILDSYYVDGSLTAEGGKKLEANLAEVPKADMMGDKYSLVKKNKIILQYWITNKENYIGKSAYRSFSVK